MARYFFDFYDGKLRRDPIGAECTGPEDICHEAMRALPEIAKGAIPQDGQEQAFTVLVRNESNFTVYTATLTYAGIWLGEDIPVREDPFD